MRIFKTEQMQLGEVDISKIKISIKSRDDIPKILRGLQYIYSEKSIRDEIFSILKSELIPNKNLNNGRPGMELWKILVMGVLRLDLNCDYDRLEELVNHHDVIRQMLGHSDFTDKYEYHTQTIKDNVQLFTPEVLDKINQVIVKSGHILLKKKDGASLAGQCDSFVVETNVHFPTDINLLYDAVRKSIELTFKLCEEFNINDSRQYRYNIRQIKRLMRSSQNSKKSKATSEKEKLKNKEKVLKTHLEYITESSKQIEKILKTINFIKKSTKINLKNQLKIDEINYFIHHAIRQIDQIDRRVMKEEIIPHEEKVFSVFEPHTEWNVKGKAGVPVELGVKVCIIKDRDQFILNHMVMENKIDSEIAIQIVSDTKNKFNNFNLCSFDKGFHSPKNQVKLDEILDFAVLPKKGKLSKARQETESSDVFIKTRRAHSAVESAINELEVHGLDKCLDHGIDGFKRYVALAVLARNIARIGAILKNCELEKEKREKKQFLSTPQIQKIAA